MLSLSTAPPREPAPPFPAQEWGWARPAPASQKAGGGGGGGTKTARKKLSEQEKALREFTCGLCKGVLGEPVSTPCGELSGCPLDASCGLCLRICVCYPQTPMAPASRNEAILVMPVVLELAGCVLQQAVENPTLAAVLAPALGPRGSCGYNSWREAWASPVPCGTHITGQRRMQLATAPS